MPVLNLWRAQQDCSRCSPHVRRERRALRLFLPTIVSNLVRFPVVPTVKTKTPHRAVFSFLFWRAQQDSNLQPTD